MDTEKNDLIDKIHRRQLARLLDHLKRTGQYTDAIEKDLKRSFGFVFEDVKQTIQEQDKDNTHGIRQ
jgi:hypothetical protein